MSDKEQRGTTIETVPNWILCMFGSSWLSDTKDAWVSGSSVDATSGQGGSSKSSADARDDENKLEMNEGCIEFDNEKGCSKCMQG